MPRIPNYEAAGTSVARTGSLRTEVDRSEAIEREGQGALLGAVGEAVAQAVEHDDKLRYAAARSTLLQAQSAARRELEADNDYETFESRYRERTAKARTAAAASIRGGRSRELFEADAQADIERGVEQIRGLARTKEVDQGVSLLNSTLEANRNAALESKDEAERIAYLEASNDSIQGALDKGYITADSAREVRTKFTTNYAEAFVGIQAPAERIEMLSKPDTNVAKYIAPDRRKALLEAAKREGNELRVRGESQAFEDQLTEQHGNDFKSALTEARQIKDPEVRDATVSRIKARQAETKQFELEDREAASEEAIAFINDGGRFADLPTSIKNRLTPSSLNAIREYADGGGAAARKVTDPATLIKLSTLSADDPQRFAELNMLDYRAQLSASDFEEFVDLQRKIRTGVLDGKATGFQSITQIRDAKLKELFGGTSAKGEKQERINAFVIKFEQQLKAFKQENGKAPSTQDARKLLDDLTAEVVTGGWFGGTKRAFELTDEDTQVPEAMRQVIIEELRAVGEPITVEAIRREYQKASSAQYDQQQSTDDSPLPPLPSERGANWGEMPPPPKSYGDRN